jgi:hypothetical protein
VTRYWWILVAVMAALFAAAVAFRPWTESDWRPVPAPQSDEADTPAEIEAC